MLNGLTNVDARVGDMFAPVAGEVFDLIVSQPPFVPQPEGAADATFLYGGRRGDELPLRLFRELPPHLAERGRAIVLVNWPVVEGDTLDGRVRAQMGNELSLLQLVAPAADLDDWCALMAFLGLVPGEDSSGEKHRRGRITKMGNALVRRILVEASWHYQHRPGVGRGLAARQAGQPPRVIAIADKAQQRLCRRFRRMMAEHKPAPKVAVAVARELAGFIWAALQPPVVA
jgi:methylase of polypeptide subunit release factors